MDENPHFDACPPQKITNMVRIAKMLAFGAIGPGYARLWRIAVTPHRMNDHYPSERNPMTTSTEIYSQADQRRQSGNLPYAGAVTPEEAATLLQLDPEARLVDVRTRAELDWVGRPQIADDRYIHIEWIRYPGSVPNAQFLEQLRAQVAPNAPLLFLCRSAARSKVAAKLATENGFSKAYDILEGFEGDKNSAGHRKTVSGWCHRGLPWIGA
ncbi:sulfurtransferase [Pandoraea thiooxydans]|nr:sulfurtransferase [Pandoraea thiooxydans]